MYDVLQHIWPSVSSYKVKSLGWITVNYIGIWDDLAHKHVKYENKVSSHFARFLQTFAI
jgi:hypothetical protein